MIRAIITDIEGTTSSLSFVKDVLFPYAREHMDAFIREHATEPEVAQQIDAVRAQAKRALSLDEVIAQLQQWIDEDKKITPLKALQGMIWADGYRRGEFYGHIYADAEQALRLWHERGISLYVYSSGSVFAQRLLFGHTEYGDLTPLFSGYFDTNVGAKTDAMSYRNISANIPALSNESLFLSDTLTELDAARAAGLHTVQLVREGDMNTAAGHPQVRDFDELDALIVERWAE